MLGDRNYTLSWCGAFFGARISSIGGRAKWAAMLTTKIANVCATIMSGFLVSSRLTRSVVHNQFRISGGCVAVVVAADILFNTYK